MSVTNNPLTLISFENDWCAQCYTQRPIIKKIQQIFDSDLDILIINAEKNQKLVRKYDIHSAPSTVLLNNGKPVEKIPRFIDQLQLTTLIRYYL